eukprot:1664165-Pyramimonas_sp.AAC.1
MIDQDIRKIKNSKNQTNSKESKCKPPKITHDKPKGTQANNKQLAWRRTQPYAVVSAAIVSIVFGGA